jgi:hypothetical protein
MQNEIEDKKNQENVKKEDLIVPPEILINLGTLRLEVGKT